MAISGDDIKKAARGDRAAFRLVYDEFSGFVYTVAFGVAANREDADDITQEVFMKTFKSLGQFEGRSSLKTWLYRLTVNTALNYVKRSSRYASRKVDMEGAIHFLRAEEKTTEILENKDREKVLAGLLGLLSEDQKRCIILRELEGMDYREMASTLKINVNTVRTRLKRAREKLMALAGRGVVTNEVR